MIEELLYEKFLKLSSTKKLDYLYIHLVDKDQPKLEKTYGPRKVDVLIDDHELTIRCDKLSDARKIKNGMIMEGMLLLDEAYQKTKNNTYIVNYLYEGVVQPICLN